jgi:hypothetical protein
MPVDLAVKPEGIAPEQMHQIEWTYIPDEPGNCDVIFGVWKEINRQTSLDYEGGLYDSIKITS